MQLKVPSHRLHRGSGQAIVTNNRQDFYLGRHNTPESRRKYNRLIAEYLSSPETFVLSASRKSDAAVSELIVAFLAFVESEEGDKEYKGIKLAMKPLRRLYGDICAKDFGTSQYKAVRAVFVREVHPVRKKPRTRQYVNRAMVYVSRLFKWAASEQLLPAGVYETLPPCAKTKRRPKRYFVGTVFESLVSTSNKAEHFEQHLRRTRAV